MMIIYVVDMIGLQSTRYNLLICTGDICHLLKFTCNRIRIHKEKSEC